MNTEPDANEKLARAASSGDLPGAQKALEQGANPDYADGWGQWAISGERPLPLHMALRRGDVEMARVIMAAGADLGARCGQGKSMGAWLSMGLDGCAQAWLEAGGDPWADARESLAVTATRGGSPALWRALAARWTPSKPSCAAWSADDRQAALFEACRWRNLSALRSMGSLGWVPGPQCVRRTAGYLVDAFGSKSAERDARAMARTLFALGAPLMDQNGPEGQKFASFWVAGSVEGVIKEFGVIAGTERAKLEARALAAAARRTGRGRHLGGRL